MVPKLGWALFLTIVDVKQFEFLKPQVDQKSLLKTHMYLQKYCCRNYLLFYDDPSDLKKVKEL